jgi:hypothetical protein
MCQATIKRLSNHFESCQTQKVASLLTEAPRRAWLYARWLFLGRELLRGSLANERPGRHRSENGSRCPRQSAQHEPAHRPVDHRLCGRGQPFVILAKEPRQAQPREGALDGLIANDKFCMSRHGRLSLRRSRRLSQSSSSRSDELAGASLVLLPASCGSPSSALISETLACPPTGVETILERKWRR